MVEAEDDQAGDEDDRTGRDKRKIGIVKLGVSNGIINFVFGVRSRSYMVIVNDKPFF